MTPDALPPAFAPLLQRWSTLADLGVASAVLAWDQETMMPPAGRAARGQALGGLAGLRHETLTDPALGEAIAACAEVADEAGPEAVALVREARRAHERALRIPAALARELAEAESESLATWQQARRDDDFAAFEPALTRIVALVRRKAEALADGGPLYDALLDLYEPGSTEAALRPLFDGLRSELAPLVQAVADSGRVVDEGPARGRFPEEAQLRFGRETAAAIGFDFDAGRLDRAAHPFCTGFDARDVRLTWRFEEDDFRPAFFGILHEAGHGLYEQGLPTDWRRTPVGSAVGLGVHESQSRLWENLVGRSRAFWEWALPRFHAAFPSSAAVTVDELWPALHTVKPSLIRVEADEATYNLHVAARFELEARLFGGQLEVAELAAAWNDAYGELLGVRPPSAADGVLQDIHWAMGAFGYFPTYTRGNLIAAQLDQAARRALPDLDGQLSRGEFAPLLGWLRDQVHRHGSIYNADELIERATGGPLSPEPFLQGIRAVAAEVYGV